MKTLKKHLYLLAAGLLMALCCAIVMPDQAQAAASQTSYRTITPVSNHTDSRVHVGKRYFWTNENNISGSYRLYCSQSASGGSYRLVCELPQAYQADYLHDVSFVTNGEMMYYVDTYNVLHMADLEAKTDTALKGLNLTFMSKLKTASVSVRAVACYGTELYLCVCNNTMLSSKSYHEYIYRYDLTTGTITRSRFGHYLTGTSRYFVYRSNTSDHTVYRYDMKKHASAKVCTGVSAASYKGKFYVVSESEDGKQCSLMEYSYSDLTGRTLKTFTYDNKKLVSVYADYVYNGCLYYMTADYYDAGYHKLNLSTLKVSGVSGTNFESHYGHTLPGAEFASEY